MTRGKLKKEDEECIQQNYVYLKDNIEALHIVDFLFQHYVITLDDREEIKSGLTRTKRNEILLTTLLNAGPGEAFNYFLKSLEESYQHVLKHIKQTVKQKKEDESLQEENKILRSELTENDGASTSEPSKKESILKALEVENSPSNWKKVEQIGVGGYSKVFSAKVNTIRGCFKIAVKKIKTNQETTNKYKESAEKEINTLKRLNHERIVSYYGFQSDAFSFYIFMENMEYGSLSNLIHVQTKGPLNEVLLKRFTEQILEGLQYLHENRTIHRDIKSDNVLLNDGENIKIADFGVSKTFGEISKATTQGVGTARHMAPEVITQDSHSYPVDVWSTGCVVLEMATGNRPFPDKTESNVYYILMGDNPSPLTYSKVSKEVETFLANVFHKDPKKRPTCADLLTDDFLKVVGKAFGMP